MITSEEVIKSLAHETGLRRTEGSVPNMLSKPEMEYLLIFIVNMKNKLVQAEEKQTDLKEIVKETIDELNNKA